MKSVICFSNSDSIPIDKISQLTYEDKYNIDLTIVFYYMNDLIKWLENYSYNIKESYKNIVIRATLIEDFKKGNKQIYDCAIQFGILERYNEKNFQFTDKYIVSKV